MTGTRPSTFQTHPLRTKNGATIGCCVRYEELRVWAGCNRPKLIINKLSVPDQRVAFSSSTRRGSVR